MINFIKCKPKSSSVQAFRLTSDIISYMKDNAVETSETCPASGKRDYFLRYGTSTKRGTNPMYFLTSNNGKYDKSLPIINTFFNSPKNSPSSLGGEMNHVMI